MYKILRFYVKSILQVSLLDVAYKIHAFFEIIITYHINHVDNIPAMLLRNFLYKKAFA